MYKHPVDSKNLRRVPSQFSWVDHRLIRARLLSGSSTCSWALYLFLVTVADEQGLSYYSPHSICEHLQVDSQTLVQARRELLERGLIAWQKPLYQVLDLRHLVECPRRRRSAPACVRMVNSNTAAGTPVAIKTETVSPEAGLQESLRLARTLEQMLKGGAQ